MTQSYDQIKVFEYWNIEAWKNFFENHILPLHISASKLLKLREFFLTIVGTDGKVTLSQIEMIRSDILPFLLGGIKEDGEYKENSLAKLVKLALGIYINPKEWVALEKEEGIRAFDYVYVKTEPTSFLEFLKKVNEITLHIIKLIGIETKEIESKEVEEIIKKPDELLEIIGTIYLKCLQICANHSYYTFFALSTRTITFKILTIAYPRIIENFDSLRKFLGLEKIFEPNVNEEKEREYYSIWSHSKGGLIDSLYNLNQIIWEYFVNDNVKSVFNYVSPIIRNLKEEYMEKIQQELEKMKWKFPDYIKFSDKHYEKNPYAKKYIYSISGFTLTKEKEFTKVVRERPFGGFHEEVYSWEKECSISLSRLLDELSPALFLSSDIFEFKISNNTLEIVR